MTETGERLLDRCRAARAAGMDFPTMWNDILKPSRLVIGPPVQAIRGDKIQLEIRLVTGGAIAFHSDSDEITFEIVPYATVLS